MKNFGPNTSIDVHCCCLQSLISSHLKLDSYGSSRPEVFCKNVFLEILQNSKENTCARVSFLIKLQAWDLQLYWKRELAQMFSCEFCGISKNTFFQRTPPVVASDSHCQFAWSWINRSLTKTWVFQAQMVKNNQVGRFTTSDGFQRHV